MFYIAIFCLCCFSFCSKLSFRFAKLGSPLARLLHQSLLVLARAPPHRQGLFVAVSAPAAHMLGRLTRGVPSAAAVAKRSLGLFAAPAVSASFSSVSAPKNSNNSSSDRCSSSSSALKPATAGRRGPLAAFFSSSATASPSSSGANVVGSEAPSAATATSTVPIDPTILTTVAEAHANVQAQVDALVQETGIVAVPVVPPRQTVAHIFIRFDVRQGVFDNSISIRCVRYAGYA